jgi:hypothetical protein
MQYLMACIREVFHRPGKGAAFRATTVKREPLYLQPQYLLKGKKDFFSGLGIQLRNRTLALHAQSPGFKTQHHKNISSHITWQRNYFGSYERQYFIKTCILNSIA